MRHVPLILVIYICSGLCPAATIHVPGDYPTIQQAIDAAMKGDTVLVAPGTYTQNLNFNGKAITVASSNGADLTNLSVMEIE